jgi:energy-converting hydrogenase A subunit M
LKVTEQDILPLDDSIESLEALINELERPTKYSRERIEQWLNESPKLLRDVVKELRSKMEVEVYPVYPVGVEQNKAS